MAKRKLRLTKSDGADIGFVCEAHGSAVTWEEFQAWFLWLIDNFVADDIPLFAYEIISFRTQDDYARGQIAVFGYTPGFGATRDERHALYGIGFLRSLPQVLDPPVGTNVPTRDEAIATLQNNPRIALWFKDLFPSLAFDWPDAPD